MKKKIVTLEIIYRDCPYTFEAFEVDGLVEVWCNAMNPEEAIGNLQSLPTAEQLKFWGEGYLNGWVNGEEWGSHEGRGETQRRVREALGI